VYRETDIEKISEIAGRRAVKYEEKLLKDRERKLVMDCIKEKEREGMKSAATEEREKFFRQNGYSFEGIRILRVEVRSVADNIRRREKERLGQWLDNKIRDSKYNVRYKDIAAFGKPGYLRRRKENGSQKTIARWRCGNEEERNKFWLDRESRRCKLCRIEEDKIEHLNGHLEKELRMRAEDILSEEGKVEAIRWMRRIGELREKRGERGKQIFFMFVRHSLYQLRIFSIDNKYNKRVKC